MKATTALRKLTGLWETDKKILCVQGSQGAGKTYGILMLIINYALSGYGREVIIASAELTKMRLTVIKDFKKIMRSFGVYEPDKFLAETLYKTPGDGFIKFIGLDKEDLGKGLRADVVFLNEANKTNFETYRELTSRARRVVLDYNPNSYFWAHDEVIPRPDCGFLKLTFEDNEYISPEERDEILMYKTKAYDDQGNVISPYWHNKWVVYGLGEIGGVQGRVFSHFKGISFSEYIKIPVEPIFAVDWGTVDPWAILEGKYKDGNMYYHGLNYLSENQWRQRMEGERDDAGIVTWMFNRLGIPKTSTIVCDNNRREKIIALRRAGWDYAIEAPKPPGSILDGIDLMQNLNVFYTTNTKEFEYETLNYRFDTDRAGNALEKPVDADNHYMDAARYRALYGQKIGEINVL